MKVKIIVVEIICVLILSVFYLFSFREKAIYIKLDLSNTNIIDINGFGSIDLNTKDKEKISKVIKYFDLIEYYRNEKLQIHNETPDTSITLLGKDEKVIDKIEFYGDLAEYKSGQYRLKIHNVHKFYEDIENLCTSINRK